MVDLIFAQNKIKILKVKGWLSTLTGKHNLNLIQQAQKMLEEPDTKLAS